MIGSGLFELSEGGKSLRTTTELPVKHPNVVSMGGNTSRVDGESFPNSLQGLRISLEMLKEEKALPFSGPPLPRSVRYGCTMKAETFINSIGSLRSRSHKSLLVIEISIE
jgi:hypothetical protein